MNVCSLSSSSSSSSCINGKFWASQVLQHPDITSNARLLHHGASAWHVVADHYTHRRSRLERTERHHKTLQAVANTSIDSSIAPSPLQLPHHCSTAVGHVVQRLDKHCPSPFHQRLRREDENIGVSRLAAPPVYQSGGRRRRLSGRSAPISIDAAYDTRTRRAVDSPSAAAAVRACRPRMPRCARGGFWSY